MQDTERTAKDGGGDDDVVSGGTDASDVGAPRWLHRGTADNPTE